MPSIGKPTCLQAHKIIRPLLNPNLSLEQILAMHVATLGSD